ncbi:hypothetical protein [Vibrio neptunius]|uniref:Lipoprotein n=1 Tax=Vibrio neptunius TaxID=170651 RepID=A0ABS2ZXZ7_9VIBR|nr:hypothetical protein [Vibrio neptunius]MBN3492438.1 hypothetical protein [Vibrio neptunius]MBN3514935.1 hypothetical protein [Vibrio neptunius]MBN3548805.1 hypothetical protein [Vibrio neptunius]MBN3577063.1 hypothetical protein [Vibrio neptunius]MCH9870727.1 hypothetical protein [Vibrio neptunius]
MRLCNLALALSILSFTACATSFEQALASYGDKLTKCNNIAKTNNKPFPVNGWFDSLSTQDKKNVVLFISMDNRETCSQKERQNLLDIAQSATPEQLKHIKLLVKNGNQNEFIKSLDINEINKIQSIYSAPFDSLRVGDELGLFE